MMAASIFVSILVDIDNNNDNVRIILNSCSGQHPACAGLLRQAVEETAGAALAPVLRRGRGDLHLDTPLLHLPLLEGGEGRS